MRENFIYSRIDSGVKKIMPAVCLNPHFIYAGFTLTTFGLGDLMLERKKMKLIKNPC